MKIALAIANTVLSVALVCGLFLMYVFVSAMGQSLGLFAGTKISLEGIIIVIGFLVFVCVSVVAGWIVALKPTSTTTTWKVLSFGSVAVLAYFLLQLSW